MVLDSDFTKQICDFVKLKPRSIQEISFHIKKNWRTTERYVELIEEKEGCIASRIFRKGTRGALKIVYWNFAEDIHNTSFQEHLLEIILRGRRKEDFSPFDIYQHVDEKKKKLYVVDASEVDHEIEVTEEDDLVGFLRQAKKQLLIFSGNMSWINAYQGDVKIIDVLKELVKKGINIKVVGRVSLIGGENASKILSINKEFGKDVIEVKHRYQPLRAMLVDNKLVKLREIRDPAFYRHGELQKMIEVFYDIADKDWILWLEKVFWRMFSSALPAEKRLKEIENIQGKLFDFH
jgi:hypothetical protein